MAAAAVTFTVLAAAAAPGVATEGPTSPPGKTGSLAPVVASSQSGAPLPRIESRRDGLYVAATGAPFVARGANYTRLATDTAGAVYHATFEPGRYDHRRVTTFLDQLRDDGYNTVRVFIDPGGAGGDHGIGRGPGTYDKVYGPYLDNVARFVAAAAARGIYTMPSLDVFPVNSYYAAIVAREGEGNPADITGRNRSYLERGRVLAKAEYVANFTAALLDRIGVAQRTAILAYQSDNEVYFQADHAPYNGLVDEVTPVNGVRYDMSDPAQRQQSADASLVEYTIRVERALTAVDPDALLAVGFFSYQAVGKQGPDGFATHCADDCSPAVDYRYPGRAGILSYWGAVDLLDVHMYGHHGAPVLDALELQHRKDPYLIGEFGALKSRYGNDIVRAAHAMRDLQREACALDAKGYLYFTWDTTEPLASLDRFFHLTDQQGVINDVLAPAARPDPCR